MIFGNEKDLIWDELNLEGLLDTMKLQREMEKQVEEPQGPQNDALIKHNKMVNKPSYSVLMDRYNSTPHKPVTVKVSKLDRLADPVKGRYTHYEKYLNTDTPSTYDDEPIAFKSTNSGNNSPVRSTSNSPTKKVNPSGRKTPPAAFFLTEGLEDDAMDDRHSPTTHSKVLADNKIAMNKLKQGNGFAAILRSRVEEANRLEKLQVPVSLNQRSTRGAVRGTVQQPRRTRPVPTKSIPRKGGPLNKPRRNWEENTNVHHIRGDNKKSMVQVVGGKKGVVRGNFEKRDTSVIRDPHTNRVKKVISSGYGVGGAGYSKGSRSQPPINKAKERVMKKIVAPEPVPSVTDVPNNVAEIKKKLRSKDTIDILDAIPEGKESMKDKRIAKSGTQSAPPGKSREKKESQNTSYDSNDNYNQQPATKMTRKVTSLNPSNRKRDEHWNQKLDPKNVHPNSYLAQKREQQGQPNNSTASSTPAAKKATATSSATVTSSVVSRNFDLLDASYAAAEVSPRRAYDISDSMFELNTSTDSFKGESKSVDIHATIAKLMSYDNSNNVSGSTTSLKGSTKNGKVDVDINSQFTRQAVKLGEYFNNADALMSKYKNLANDLE